ncbi:MAG: MATE family efflux transporter [Anaerolineales bacterium]|nr:MATE family efflux transporter [Anaerolineales bacterium]
MKRNISLPAPIQFVLHTFQDREYLGRILKLALPITLQQFLFASLNLVATLMVGQLGETSVAAVGLSGQVAFLLNLMLFGVNSGAAIFTAQYWGKQDVTNIRRVMGFALLIGLAGSGFFTLVAVLAPAAALGIYTKDPAVVAAGENYLRIIGISFIFSAITYTFSSVLRSTGNVRLPVTIGAFSLALNTLLSYLLIFGKLGLPTMGINGAAVALLIARGLECVVLLALAYRMHTPAAATLPEMFTFDRVFTARILRRVLPVALNEVLWSLGITTYNIIYARISTESIAAVNIAATIDSLAFVFFIGIGNACAILVGNIIGTGDEEKAFRYAGRTLALAMSSAVVIGVLVLAGSNLILGYYKVSPDVIDYTRRILMVVAFALWIRSANMVLFVGIFRSGGDTRFALILDGGTIWVVGVPLAAAAAFILHLPVYWVYLFVMTEELTKWLVGMRRFATRKWIHHLAV